MVGGFMIELLGVVCLARGLSSVAKVLSIYPGSVLFYLIPRAVTNGLSEAMLFYVGFLSGAVLWAVILFLFLLIFKFLFLRLRPTSRLPPPQALPPREDDEALSNPR
jgi:threonine/homoserine/homoserine lactone efflux protein